MDGNTWDAEPDPEFIRRARSILGAPGVFVAADDKRLYEHGFYGERGRALAVLSPADTDETVEMLRLCAEFGLEVLPQGGNTGLVGASIPDKTGAQVVLSTRRMDQLAPVDLVNRSVCTGAGVRMSQLRAALKAAGMWFPFEIAADPCVGGMVSTNTGGSHLVRYGDLRRSVLGLEVVLADGTVIDSLRALRKDNTGPDCKQLFIGSGGSFGIVTRAVLEVQRLPLARTAALVVPRSHADLPELLRWLEARYGEMLTTFEGMSGNAIRYAYAEFPKLKRFFTDEAVPEYAVLVDVASSSEFCAASLVDDFHAALAGLAGGSVIRDVVTGCDADFWALRDAIPYALSRQPLALTFDVSFARSRLTMFRDDLCSLLARRYPGVVLADFGHFAEGGDHATVVIPESCKTAQSSLQLMRLRGDIYETVAAHAGSFSAEHGLGPFNENVYRRYAPGATRELNASLKRMLDPAGRLGRIKFN
jgi:FAD/FMN-containing dehydrogenase